MNAQLLEKVESLHPEEKFLLLDNLWVSEHPQFEHRPAKNLADFVLNPFFLGLKGQIWETPLADLVEYYRSGKREFWLEESIGAGKSFQAAIVACYEVHKLLCLRNPQRFFNLSQSSKITVLNMSVSERQAYDIVFGEIQGKIDNSYWFKKFAQPDPDKKSRYEFDKRIYIIPGNSRETTALGYSVIVGLLDEANFFTDTDDNDNADEVYDAMERRIFSRFKEYGRLGVISSPNHDSDFLSRKREHGIPGHVFYRNRTLWEAKAHEYQGVPMIEVEKASKDHAAYSIPATLKDEYDKNPEKFKRDFGAIAIGGLELFIKDRAAIESALVLDNQWTGQAIHDDFKSPGVPCYGHIDLAKNKDAAGIAIACKIGNKISVPFLARITAQPGGEIKISGIRDIVYALRQRGFYLAKVTLDGWQSLDTIQQFNAKGIPSEELSVDRTLEPYDTFKEILYSGTLECAKDPVLRRELRKLQIIKGKKVDHPKGGSKDLADAVCGAVFNCVQGEDRPETNKQYGSEFVDGVHVQNLAQPEIGVSRYMALVPSLNGPSAAVWALADRAGRVYFYEEAVIYRATSSKIKETVKAAESLLPYRIEERYHPAIKQGKEVQKMYTLIEQLDDEGLPFESIEYNEELASMNIREGLQYDRLAPVSGKNLPHLFFNPKCTMTLQAIKYYLNSKNQDNDPLNELFHKAVGTLILAEPEYMKPGRRQEDEGEDV